MSSLYCATHGSQSRVCAARSTVASKVVNASASSSRVNTLLATGQTRTRSRRVCRAWSGGAERPAVTERHLERHLERAEQRDHDAGAVDRLGQGATLQADGDRLLGLLHGGVHAVTGLSSRGEVHIDPVVAGYAAP